MPSNTLYWLVLLPWLASAAVVHSLLIKQRFIPLLYGHSLILRYRPRHTFHCSLLVPYSLPIRNYYQLNNDTVAGVSVLYANKWEWIFDKTRDFAMQDNGVWKGVSRQRLEVLQTASQKEMGQKASLRCHFIWFCWHCILLSRSWFHCLSRFSLHKSNESIWSTSLHCQLILIQNIEGYVFGLALYSAIVLTYLASYKIPLLAETVCGI